MTHVAWSFACRDQPLIFWSQHSMAHGKLTWSQHLTIRDQNHSVLVTVQHDTTRFSLISTQVVCYLYLYFEICFCLCGKSILLSFQFIYFFKLWFQLSRPKFRNREHYDKLGFHKQLNYFLTLTWERVKILTILFLLHATHKLYVCFAILTLLFVLDKVKTTLSTLSTSLSIEECEENCG